MLRFNKKNYVTCKLKAQIQTLAKTVKKEATEINKLAVVELAAMGVMKITADK